MIDSRLHGMTSKTISKKTSDFATHVFSASMIFPQQVTRKYDAGSNCRSYRRLWWSGTAISQSLCQQGAQVIATYYRQGNHESAKAWQQQQKSLGF